MEGNPLSLFSLKGSAMQMIVIGGTEAEKELKALAEFANKPENYYDGNKASKPQKEGAKHCRNLIVQDSAGEKFEYGVIFTITEVTDGGRVRHATITCRDGAIYPDEIATFTICHFLGFKGTLKDWHAMGHPDKERAVVIFQELVDG